MARAPVHVDTKVFQLAMREYSRTTKRAWPEIVNQRAANIVRHMLEKIPPKPGTEQAKRGEIRADLTAMYATKVKLATSGKRKGKFIKAGSHTFSRRRGKGKDRALRRVHLIAQAARAKAGKKGLYGEEMRKYASKMVRSRQVGVGWIKAALVPLARGINSFIKYKIPHRFTARISRWPGSIGSGIVRPARSSSMNPVANLENTAIFQGTKAGAAARRIWTSALRYGVLRETIEIRRHMKRKLEQAANRFNRR